MRARTWKKLAGALVAASAVVVGGIGFLHMPAARPLLRMLGGGCPLKASAAEVESARLTAARETRGTDPAPARPALGFMLDVTSSDDVRAWAKKAGIACKEEREGTYFACADVPAASLGEAGRITDVSFGFSPTTKRLVNLTTLRLDLTGDDAARQLASIAARLEKELGAPSSAAGEPSGTYLSSGDMHTSMMAYRYADYMADVSATKIPQAGVAVREHYMSARD